MHGFMPLLLLDRTNAHRYFDRYPMELLVPCEARALENHGQTIKQLTERGGISASEALAIIRNVRHSSVRKLSEEYCLQQLSDHMRIDFRKRWK